MNNVLKLGKKVFTVGVVLTTIMWSVGVAALVPGVANAAECPVLTAGTVVKVGTIPTLYVIGNDLKLVSGIDNQVVTVAGKKLYFSGFKSWGSTDSYGTIVNITASCYTTLGMSDKAFGWRPGSMLLKHPVTGDLIVNLPNRAWAKISLEAAKALYGYTSTMTLPPFSTNDFLYSLSGGEKPMITEAKAHDGMLVSKAGKTYLVDGVSLREVTAVGMAANGYKASYVHMVTESATAGYTTGTTVDAMVAALTDKTQSGGAVTPPVVVTTGAVTVALAADTAATQSGLPIGSTNIDVLKFNVTNSGSTDMTIDEVTLKRGGTGAVTGLTAYVYNGETRVGSGKTFASDSNEATFSVMNTLVKAGQTLPLVVRLKVGTTATTGNHIFSVNGMKLASGTVTGLPVTGNLMSVNSGITAGSVTVDANGSLSNPSIGDENVALAQFKVTVGTEDVNVNSLTLKQDGTLDTSLLSNFKLYQGTAEVPSTVSVSGRYVTFVLAAPFKILNGNNKIFTVKGNVSSASEAGKTVTFFMYDSNDMKAVGASYGYGVSVDNALYNATDDNSLDTTLNLQGGNVTISNKSEAAHDLKVDTTENVLGKVGITAKADTIEIQKMVVKIETTKATLTDDYGTYVDTDDDGDYDAGEVLMLRNIKLKDADTGRTIGSAKAITDAVAETISGSAITAWAATNDVDATLAFEFTDYFTVAKGTTRNVVLTADVYSSQISGVIYKATFDFSSTNFTVKDSKDVAVTGVVPATTIASNNITTRSSTLTISRATTPEAKTVVKGSTVDALGIIMTAGSGVGNDVKLSSLTLNTFVNSSTAQDSTFTAAVEETVDANELVGMVELYDGATKIAESSVDTSGNVIFESNDFVGGFYNIPAGSSKTLVARAYVSGNAPYLSVINAFAFTLQAADVTVESNGTSFTPEVTGTDLNGTTAPTVWIGVTTGGTITTAADNSKPLAQLLTAGLTTEQEVHRIKLTATKETFTVDKMAVGVSSADTTYDDVEYLRLYDVNGVALTEATNLNGTGTSTFTGLNISVPVGGVTVVVKAKLTSIGERTTATDSSAGTGADSGDALTFALSTVADEFHAVGGSGTVDTTADAAASNSYKVAKTIPGFVVSSLPSSVLSSNNTVIFKFTVTAGATEDVTLARVTPYITFSDSDGGNELLMTAETLEVFDMANASTALNTADNALSSTTGAFGINFTTSTALPVIGKGQTKTFEIRATFSGVESNDQVSVKFVQDSAALSGIVETGALSVADSNAKFIWSDNGADTDAFTSTDWMNSFLVPAWDTKSLSVSKS